MTLKKLAAFMICLGMVSYPVFHCLGQDNAEEQPPTEEITEEPPVEEPPVVAEAEGEEALTEPAAPEAPSTPSRGILQPLTTTHVTPSVTPQPSQPGKLTLDIKGMDITDVLKMLATRSGLNIVVGKNVSGRVTLFLKDVDTWEAFEIILFANDLAYQKKGDIINVMTQRDYELQCGERFQDRKEVKIVKLKYAKAMDLTRALTQIKSNIGRVIPDEASNTLVLVDIPVKINEMETFARAADMPIETRIFSLNYAQAEKLSAKLQESVTKGIGSLKIDERTNKIAITDYPSKLDDLALIISAFDEKTPQVLIDAQIIEVSPKDQFTMGIDWDYWIRKNFRLANALSAPAIGNTTATSSLSYGVAAAGDAVSSSGDYKSIISVLKILGETKVLSSPRLMVINNQEAKILVGTKDAYITSSTSQSEDASVTSQTVNFVDVGLKLYVTPTINKDGFITMKIKPEVSSSVRTEITSEGKVTQIPIVTTSESESTIMVKDGMTIIIAGLKRDNRTTETKKIPVLGDIPLLGSLARSHKDDIQKTELVIFITPRIISGDMPMEYASLTHDNDIQTIQARATRTWREHKAREISFDDYKAALGTKIRKKCSPAPLTGEVTVAFALNANGTLASEPTITASTNDALNAPSIDSVKKAAPFGAFPEKHTKTTEEFSITLSYE